MANRIFVGREQELDILQHLFEETKQGLGKVVFVSGEPGSGKTALTRYFIEETEKKQDILSAISECTDKEGLNSYATFKDILLELNVDAATDNQQDKKKLKTKLKDFISEAGPKWIGFIPVIGSIASAGIETAQAIQKHFGKEQEQEATSEKEIGEIIENELRRLALKNPVIVFIDDLQWSDTASLNLLYSLSLSLRKKPFPMMLISTYRPNEIKAGRNKISDTGENITIRHPLVDKLNELRNYTKKESHITRTDQWLYELSVPALNQENIQNLLQQRFPENHFPATFLQKLNDLTNGHALFVNEILESLITKEHIYKQNNQWYINETEISELPISVNGVIAERVDRLDKHLRKVLDYAGVYGQDFDLQIIEQVLKIDELDLLDYIQELREKHGLVVSGEARVIKDMVIDLYKFTHALVQKYIYEHQEAARRRVLHKRMAMAIQELYGDSLSKNPDAKNLYEQHKRIGSGVIDGLDFTFSKETVQNETQDSIIDFANEEKKAAQKAYDEFATHECNERVDRALAFINQLNTEDTANFKIRFDTLFIRSQNQLRSGLYENARMTCDILISLSESTHIITDKALSHKQKGAVLVYLGHYDNAVLEITTALNIYQALGNQEKEVAECYNERGVAYNSSGQYDLAETDFEKALELNRKLSLIDEIAETLSNLGSSYRFRADFVKAKPLYEQALPLAQALNKKQLIAKIYNNIGLSINGLGHFAEAIPYFEKALAIDHELNDTVNSANHINNIGLSHENQGNYDEAIRYYTQSLNIDESLDDRVKMAISYNNIGNVYREKAEFDKSLDFYNKALEINLEKNDKVGIANTYTNLGNLYYVTLELEKAKEYMELSLAISIELEDEGAMATDYNNIGNVLYSLSQYDEAFEKFQKTVEIHTKFGNRIYLASSYNNMGNVMYMKDENQEALKYYGKSAEISTEFNDLVSMARTFGNMAVLYQETEDYDNTKLHFEKAIEIDRQIQDEVNLVQHLFKYAKHLYTNHSSAESEPVFTEAIKLFRKIGHNDEDMLKAMSYKAYITTEQDSKNNTRNAVAIFLNLYETALKKQFEEYAALTANDLAEYFERIPDFNEALVWRQKAADYFLTKKDYNQIAESYEALALNYFNQAQYNESLNILNTHVVNNYEQSGNQTQLGGAYNRIANCYLNLENYAKAEEYYLKALEIFKGDNYSWEAILYFNLGLCTSKNSAYEKAIGYFNQAMELYYRIEEFQDSAESLYRIAENQMYMDDLDNCVKNLKLARELYLKYGMDTERVDLLYSFLEENTNIDFSANPGTDNDDSPPDSDKAK